MCPLAPTLVQELVHTSYGRLVTWIAQHIGAVRILFKVKRDQDVIIHIRSRKEIVHLRLNISRRPEVVSSP